MNGRPVADSNNMPTFPWICLASGGGSFAEGSSYDKLFGVGLDYNELVEVGAL